MAHLLSGGLKITTAKLTPVLPSRSLSQFIPKPRNLLSSGDTNKDTQKVNSRQPVFYQQKGQKHIFALYYLYHKV
jgi:hypothetical protein